MKRPRIVVCGSSRFFEEIREVGQQLQAMGYLVLEPLAHRAEGYDPQEGRVNALPEDLGMFAFAGLTYHHLGQIRKADICLVYNKGGYIGNSTSLELGYAVALGLLICAWERDLEDPCINVLFDYVVGDTEGLANLLRKEIL